MASPGTMIISRSMTLRSSRTLPGQRIVLQHGHRAGDSKRLRPPAVLAREVGHEVIGQQRDVLLPIAQRRHEDRDHVQAEVEVLAEPAAANLRLQILVGRREHARRPP